MPFHLQLPKSTYDGCYMPVNMATYVTITVRCVMTIYVMKDTGLTNSIAYWWESFAGEVASFVVLGQFSKVVTEKI